MASVGPQSQGSLGMEPTTSSLDARPILIGGWRRSYRAHEAGVVPGVTQSLDELITSFHGEVAAVTLGAEQSHVIWKHRWIRGESSAQAQPAAAASPFSQYGSPSSMWNRLFPNAFPQAAQTKQVVCQVCRRACITS